MKFSKDQYVLRNFSKIQHKQWELYIITRIVHNLNDPEIEFVCQQLIKTSDGKRYLADLCFPSLKLYYEIDEAHHSSKQNKLKDEHRQREIIDATDFDWNTDEFGPDAQQTVTFSFLRNNLIDKGNVVIEVGDVIEWNYAYFEVDTINENKLIGGNVEQNFDVIASAHMTRQSKLNIVERQR